MTLKYKKLSKMNFLLPLLSISTGGVNAVVRTGSTVSPDFQRQNGEKALGCPSSSPYSLETGQRCCSQSIRSAACTTGSAGTRIEFEDSVDCCLDAEPENCPGFACRDHDSVPECGDSWLLINGQCYLWSDTGMNWFDAKQFCLDNQGHLVEVEDEAEQTSLAQHLPKDSLYWLGLNDQAVEGSYVWDHSGKAMTYESWWGNNIGPNDCCATSNCICLWPVGSPSHWNDGECGWLNYGVAPLKALCEPN